MDIFLQSNETTAKFETASKNFTWPSISSNSKFTARTVQFTVSSEQSSVSLKLATKTLEKEAQTERLNRSLALGYMPALRKTSI